MVRYRYDYNDWPVGEGWYPLIEEMITKIAVLAEDFEVNILNIKEKFGGLQTWIDKPTEEMYEVIRECEDKSYTICEFCGKPGKYRGSLAWKRTLCDLHFEEEKQRQNEYATELGVDELEEEMY